MIQVSHATATGSRCRLVAIVWACIVAICNVVTVCIVIRGAAAALARFSLQRRGWAAVVAVGHTVTVVIACIHTDMVASVQTTTTCSWIHLRSIVGAGVDAVGSSISVRVESIIVAAATDTWSLLVWIQLARIHTIRPAITISIRLRAQAPAHPWVSFVWAYTLWQQEPVRLYAQLQL